MSQHLKIDFVSDVSCPWCAVGLGALEQALSRVKDEITADIRFQPFELNPSMGPEGQDIVEHLTQKYGSTEAQQADIRQTICERGAEVGFEFNPAGRGRIWNTFDAHRLLFLAEHEGTMQQQAALKKAMLAACHTRSQSMSDKSVLLAVPAVIINDRHLISGGQPAEAFEQALRQIAAQA